MEKQDVSLEFATVRVLDNVRFVKRGHQELRAVIELCLLFCSRLRLLTSIPQQACKRYYE